MNWTAVKLDAQKVRLIFTLLAVATTVRTVSAQDNHYTQEEYRALPRPCLAQISIHKMVHPPVVSEAEQLQFAVALGESYKHYHHYCWGLIDMRRASQPERRDYNYRSAANNFQYVIRNATEDFPLLPEVYLRSGMALRFLHQDADAASAFVSAIRLKRDYTPAYAALIELHLDLGDRESAETVLATGLRIAPSSQILMKKRADLAADNQQH